MTGGDGIGDKGEQNGKEKMPTPVPWPAPQPHRGLPAKVPLAAQAGWHWARSTISRPEAPPPTHTWPKLQGTPAKATSPLEASGTLRRNCSRSNGHLFCNRLATAMPIAEIVGGLGSEEFSLLGPDAASRAQAVAARPQKQTGDTALAAFEPLPSPCSGCAGH